MPPARSFLPRITASVTAVALSIGLSSVTPQIAEAGQLEQKTTFLGIEGEGDEVRSLSDALRWELTQRGRDDGRTMSLAELKLTMGCGDGDIPCYAQGGETLGSDELVFGTMTTYGANFKVTLQVLNVQTGKVDNEIERELTPAELNEGNLAKTATSLVDELYKVKPTAADIPPEPGDGPGEGETTEGEGVELGGDDSPSDTGTLVWGPYSPRPTWKIVGLGVTGGLTLAALGTAIGTTVAIGDSGPIRRDLIAAAEASLEDDKPANDIDPNSNGDLCALAQAVPDPMFPNQVTNKAVTEVCLRADRVAAVATASWVATGVFAIGTLAFTTLLFVHKEDPTAAKLLKHEVEFGGAPLQGGGFALGGSFSF